MGSSTKIGPGGNGGDPDKVRYRRFKFYVGYLKVTKLPLDWADERSREQIEAASKDGRGSRLLHYQVQLDDGFHHLDIDQL